MVIFWILFSIVILSWILLTHTLTVRDYAVKKGYESTKVWLIGLIPIYGLKYFIKKPNLKDTSESTLKYAWAPNVLIARAFGTLLITTLALLVIIPLAAIVYLSFNSNFLISLLVVFFLILALVVHQGLVVDFAEKKGYSGLVPILIGLVPIYGFIHYLKLPARRNIQRDAFRKTFKPSNVFSRILINGEIILLSIIVIVPVIYMVGMALSNIGSGIPNTIWPENPNIESFKFLFNETNFGNWYKNTIIIAMINMLIGTLLVTGAAYVYARFSFKGKKSSLLSLLVLQSFPTFMGLIAMFVLFNTFGLTGRPWALSILYIGGAIPGNLWLIKGFLGQIPKDLDESANIDGANKLQIFVRIILPLSLPIITFVAVNLFMAPWMDYMLPGYLLNVPATGTKPEDIPQQWTLAVGLFDFINNPQNANYSAFAAGAIIVGLPITILYMVFQKYLIEGITAGATKG